MGSTSLLETRGLAKSFGRLMAVNQVDLEVTPGELAAIIGPNGAGKTTFFNLLTGRLRPTSGSVFFQGEDITGLPPHRIVRKGISRSFQITHIFPELTVYENLRIGVLSRRGETSRLFARDASFTAATAETAELIKALGLVDQQERLCSTLSHADQRLVEIGVALANQPTLLLLDEPTAGMGPGETEEMVSFIRKLGGSQDMTILLTEHDMSVVFSIAQRIIVLHQGSVIADGHPEEIKANKAVKEAYLGE